MLSAAGHEPHPRPGSARPTSSGCRPRQDPVGAFDEALDLLAVAEAGSLTDLEQAQVDLVRAQLASTTNRGNDVVPLLLKAAKRLEPVDAAEARLTYLDAFSAAIFAGRLAKPGGDVREVARVWLRRRATTPHPWSD